MTVRYVFGLENLNPAGPGTENALLISGIDAQQIGAGIVFHGPQWVPASELPHQLGSFVLGSEIGCNVVANVQMGASSDFASFGVASRTLGGWHPDEGQQLSTQRWTDPDPFGPTTVIIARPVEPSATPSLREHELAWLQHHPFEVQQHTGRWVAVEGDGIVAVGDSEADADRLARDRGVTVPFVVYIPGEGDPPLIAICRPAIFR